MAGKLVTEFHKKRKAAEAEKKKRKSKKGMFSKFAGLFKRGKGKKKAKNIPDKVVELHAKKKKDRQKQVEDQLRKSGLTQAQIDKLRGKKNK